MTSDEFPDARFELDQDGDEIVVSWHYNGRRHEIRHHSLATAVHDALLTAKTVQERDEVLD